MVDRIEDDTAALYNSEYFQKAHDGQKHGYDNYLLSPASNLLGKYNFARLVGANKGNHTDVGCADGSMMELFKQDGFHARGIDISDDIIRIAREKGLDAHVLNLDTDTVLEKRLTNNAYVTAFDVLEHSAKPGSMLRSIRSMLSDDGLFVFTTLKIDTPSPIEYWFNNSLEHYVYFTEASINTILAEVFGPSNYKLFSVTVNGVNEFWGVASKGELSKDVQKKIELLSTKSTTARGDDAYLMSLIYNQQAAFTESRLLIEKHSTSWDHSQRIKAKFYNYYFEGRLEKACEVARRAASTLSLDEAAFWQTVAYAEKMLSGIEKQTIRKESEEEILDLRGQLFKTRDELHVLRNSRVVGRIIKLRDAIGDFIPKLKHFPMRAIRALKVRVARYLPGWIRHPFMKVVRRILHGPPSKVKTTKVQLWDTALPLVSVIVPYYNRADVIDDTLFSIQQQTFGNIEVIIVDDGSPDRESIEKFNLLKDSGYPATFVRQKNQGVARTRNNGIKIAKGKYIVCLDSDDIIEPTYIEKAVAVLELNPDIAVVSSYMTVFGVMTEEFHHATYDPIELYKNNTVITAAMFRKQAWKVSGGYKADIGYEDWEYWINLAEHGFFATQIPEPLFRYRTSMQSRYVEDKDIHWNNLKKIRSLHPEYKKKVRAILKKRQAVKFITSPEGAMVNMFAGQRPIVKKKHNILLAIPWMTFGGAETLIYNFCREIADDYNITFVTGLKSDNEWEYKFREIATSIYHMPNLLPTELMYEEYLLKLIEDAKIDTIHIVHSGFVFSMLPAIKEHFPNIRIVVTLFNDRAAYFEQSLPYAHLIDTITSDNNSVIEHYRNVKVDVKDLRVIPNGINCVDVFNPGHFNPKETRSEFNISDRDISVFFIGRLSEEKNPDVFVKAAKNILEDNRYKQKFKFFVVGDGKMRGDIEKAIDTIDSDRLEYLGYRSDIAHVLSAADVFILPSSIEGFPLSILEAMAMNTATIASDVGAVSEVIESGVDGFVIEPGSVDAITTTLAHLADDPNHLAAIQKSSRITVEKKYSNPILAKNYRNLYNKER
jgi:glycosyltransferase involved in cell wall biosynthesis/2-polyprenyl-3-methyl-5-hydroxy-6-metoxy-1,4-benzoquinol methylase